MSTNIVDLDEIIRYIGAMIAPEQSRAARAWLNWSQADLADKAGVGLSTIRDFEKGKRKPIGNNMVAIRKAFYSADIEFLTNENGHPEGIKAPAVVS